MLQALGAAGESLLLSLLRQVVLILPAAWLLGRIGPGLMWLSFPLAESLSCLAALLFFRRLCRKRLSGL